MEPAADPRTLLLLRHAKASHEPGVPDAERPLTERGRRDAGAAGQQLSAWGLTCDLVLCSPAVRTRETWDQARAGGAEAVEVRYRDEIYEASRGELLALVQEVPEAARTVLVVGHGPGLPGLAHFLAGLAARSAPPAGAAARLAPGYPTSGLARFVSAGSWSELGPASAELEAFEVPRG